MSEVGCKVASRPFARSLGQPGAGMSMINMTTVDGWLQPLYPHEQQEQTIAVVQDSSSSS